MMFDRETWLFILRALEWDEESAKYYEDSDYDFAMNARLHAEIRDLIGDNNE